MEARMEHLMMRTMLQPTQEVPLALVYKALVGAGTAENYQVEIPWVCRLMARTLAQGRLSMTRT